MVYNVYYDTQQSELFKSFALTTKSSVCGYGGASSEAPGLQEGEQSLLKDVEDCGEEEGECQEDEQFVSELSAVVLGDEFPPELNGPRHGLEFFIGLLDCPRGGGLKTCFRNRSRE